ncbi:MarR family winged helix-turn-helix transcriptional regulator [Aureimonas leprariae]|uniref:MarR family transcriptional regulator n=1 Tax=Plantimonas leprariae TaxID=2615207 RepID=A0A7V7TVU8_9HYPH|nr:MarR family transcriptional regulator [Aureimonas leprariae]KAB0678477.1 MarR family transcriptional regulator [Aureimonas leprariae]
MILSQSVRFDVTSNLDRASRQWRRLAREIVEAHGISQACAMPLITIGRMGEGVRQGPLADEIGIEGPSLVRLLDQLAAAELVERRDDPSDRRAKTLWLTAKGRAVTRHIEDDLTRLRAAVLGGVPEADLQAVLRVYAALDAAVEATATTRTRAA